MTDHPLESEDDKLPEAEADERFNRLVGNLVNTPHAPHKPRTQPSKDRRDREA
jgi:hypothetical protein